MRKKIVVISISLSVGFVIVMLFLFHREEPKVDPTTDEIADVVGQPQRFERNEASLRSKVGGNQKNSDTVTTGPTPSEVTTPDAVKPLGSPNGASDAVSEAEDAEFEAQWKQLKALVKERYGKDIEEIEAEYYTDLRLRVDKGTAQIEPLFEDMAFYKAQVESLKRQGRKNSPEFSVAWNGFRQAQGRLYVLHGFLKQGPARYHFGHLYLSTPEYDKLTTFAEDLDTRLKKRIVYR